MTELPFGEWPSPVTARVAAETSKALTEVSIVRGMSYFLESRPAEGGRNVVMRADPWSEAVDVTPEGFNARTRVHEYGGGSYWVDPDSVFFTNFSDQRIYRQDDWAIQSRSLPTPAEDTVTPTDGFETARSSASVSGTSPRAMS